MSLDASFRAAFEARQGPIEANQAAAFQGPNMVVSAIAAGLDAQVKSQQAQYDMQRATLASQVATEEIRFKQMGQMLDYDLRMKDFSLRSGIAKVEHEQRVKTMEAQAKNAVLESRVNNIRLVEAEAQQMGQFALAAMGTKYPDLMELDLNNLQEFQALAAENPLAANFVKTQIDNTKTSIIQGLAGQMKQLNAEYTAEIREIGDRIKDPLIRAQTVAQASTWHRVQVAPVQERLAKLTGQTVGAGSVPNALGVGMLRDAVSTPAGGTAGATPTQARLYNDINQSISDTEAELMALPEDQRRNSPLGSQLALLKIQRKKLASDMGLPIDADEAAPAGKGAGGDPLDKSGVRSDPADPASFRPLSEKARMKQSEKLAEDAGKLQIQPSLDRIGRMIEIGNRPKAGLTKSESREDAILGRRLQGLALLVQAGGRLQQGGLDPVFADPLVIAARRSPTAQEIEALGENPSLEEVNRLLSRLRQ